MLQKAAREASTAEAVKAQKAEQFYNKAEEDLRHLSDELDKIKDAANIIIGKADDLENRVSLPAIPNTMYVKHLLLYIQQTTPRINV